RRDPDDREPGSYDGVNNNRLAEIANAIIAERAELVLVTGDLVDGGSLDLETQLELWKSIMQPVYDAGITVMPVRGNHEIAGGTPGNDWKAVFPEIPDTWPYGDGYSYYIDRRNTRFIGIDVYYPGAYNQVTQDIRDWLDGDEDVLAQNPKTHAFVCAHPPTFGPRSLSDSLFWATLEDEDTCRIYFCGHIHMYDHSMLENPGAGDDVHQMMVGTAGAPLEGGTDKGPEPPGPYLGRPCTEFHEVTDKYGYVVVEVWGQSNITTHWKQRVDTVFNGVSDKGYHPLNNNDVFEY
ncbi:MAG: metallophosphoesterase family protein, partial [Planctomycetota bacterium]